MHFVFPNVMRQHPDSRPMENALYAMVSAVCHCSILLFTNHTFKRLVSRNQSVWSVRFSSAFRPLAKKIFPSGCANGFWVDNCCLPGNSLCLEDGEKSKRMREVRAAAWYGCIHAGWIWLVVWNIWIIFPIMLGMSSSQLTNSMIFQRGRLNHQPDHY